VSTRANDRTIVAVSFKGASKSANDAVDGSSTGT